MRWIILCLLGLPACLYVGGRNHPPDGMIQFEGKQPTTIREIPLTLMAQGWDADDDELTYSWWIKATSAEDNETYFLTALDGSTAHPKYDKSADSPILSTAQRLSLTGLPFRGHYQATVRIADPYGAAKIVSQDFEITNQPPVLNALRLELDPQAKGDCFPDFDNSLPIHAHYLVRASNDDQEIDLESDLTCGQRGSIQWELLQPDQSTLEYWEVAPCKENVIQDSQLRFRFLSQKFSEPTLVKIRATARDGFGGQASYEQGWTLMPNRPPCIEATVPPFNPVDLPTVFVMHEEGKEFSVAQTNDDVREGLVFTWMVKDQNAFQFVPVPGINGPSFKMPAYFRFPGNVLELRVVIQDLDSPYPTCQENETLCRQAQRLPPQCYQWITWTVNFQ